MDHREPNETTLEAMRELEEGRGERFDSVWDALEDTPQDAQLMRLRSSLLMEITQRVTQWEARNEDAAKRLGVTPNELAAISDGKIHQFSLEVLLGMCARSGLRVELSVTDV